MLQGRAPRHGLGLLICLGVTGSKRDQVEVDATKGERKMKESEKVLSENSPWTDCNSYRCLMGF